VVEGQAEALLGLARRALGGALLGDVTDRYEDPVDVAVAGDMGHDVAADEPAGERRQRLDRGALALKRAQRGGLEHGDELGRQDLAHRPPGDLGGDDAGLVHVAALDQDAAQVAVVQDHPAGEVADDEAVALLALAQRRYGGALGGDVLELADPAQRAALVVAQEGQVREHPDDRAVRADEALLALVRVAPALQDVPGDADVGLAVVRVGELLVAAADPCWARPSIVHSASLTRTYWPSGLKSAMPIGA
jgi:hypothetical protein